MVVDQQYGETKMKLKNKGREGKREAVRIQVAITGSRNTETLKQI